MVKGIRSRWESSKSKRDVLNDNIRKLESSIEVDTKKVGELNTSIELDQKSMEVFKAISQELSLVHIRNIEVLVTQALQSIFVDRDLQFKVNIIDYRNQKAARMVIVEQGVEVDVRNVGGGWGKIIGFILRLYYLMRNGNSRIMFIDEAFGAISSQYVDSFIAFMRELVDKYDFRFVMVNHDPRFSDLAEVTYTFSKGEIENVERR